MQETGIIKPRVKIRSIIFGVVFTDKVCFTYAVKAWFLHVTIRLLSGSTKSLNRVKMSSRTL